MLNPFSMFTSMVLNGPKAARRLARGWDNDPRLHVLADRVETGLRRADTTRLIVVGAGGLVLVAWSVLLFIRQGIQLVQLNVDGTPGELARLLLHMVMVMIAAALAYKAWNKSVDQIHARAHRDSLPDEQYPGMTWAQAKRLRQQQRRRLAIARAHHDQMQALGHHSHDCKLDAPTGATGTDDDWAY